MDATALARALLEPVPANRTAGIEVLRAEDGAAQVALETPYALRNVIGSLHASGLVALLDAAGLAALVAACEEPSQFEGVVPLGAAATMEFLAAADGGERPRADRHGRRGPGRGGHGGLPGRLRLERAAAARRPVVRVPYAPGKRPANI
ncbi:hypothetical protein ACFWVC_08955 [Streptomyces sp. NPDC058691]|uniref:hypothetical protein n=1 Tax=Streptomyces sp. NPDC058691 TaxID=3346601 RepID=UPI003659C172